MKTQKCKQEVKKIIINKKFKRRTSKVVGWERETARLERTLVQYTAFKLQYLV